MADDQTTPEQESHGGINFDLLSSMAQNASAIQQGQELLKRFNSPELQRNWMDGFVWNHQNAVWKQEERTRITEQLHMMAQNAYKTGREAIVPAFFRPLKEGEAQQLLKTHMASPQGQLASGIQRELSAPVGSDLPTAYAAAQGQPSNTAPMQAFSPGRPPTIGETAERAGPAIAKFLPLLALAGGKFGDMLKAQEETRKTTAAQTFAQPSSAPGQTIPLPTPVPAAQATPAQGPSGVAVQDQAFATRAQAANVNPQLALAVRGNEGSSPDAVSYMGATGTWQLMPQTAKPYLAQLGYPAERISNDNQIRTLLKDPALNEHVALLHLRDLSEKYPGRPDLALAAYHGGPGAVLPDGTVNPDAKEPDTATRKGLYTTEYVRRGMARMAQASIGRTDIATTPPGQAAGTTSPAQAQVPGPQGGIQTLSLPRFQVDFNLGSRLGESGLVSKDYFEAKHRSSIEHLTRTVTSDPRLAPYVLEQLSTAGHLTPKDIADVVPFVSQQAFALALRDPRVAALSNDPIAQFRLAKDIAARSLSPAGVTPFPFDPNAVKEFADPVVLAGAITAEQERARAQAFTGQPLTPKQVEQERGTVSAETAGKRVTTEAEATTAAQRAQTLGQVDKSVGESKFYVYTGLNKTQPLATMRPNVRYGTAMDAMDRGEVIPVPLANQQRLQAVNNIVPMFQNYLSKLETVYGPGGIFEKLSAAGRIPATARNTWQSLFPSDAALNTAKRQADTLISPIARTLSADVGNMAVLEAERYKGALAQVQGIPDTAETAAQLSSDLIDVMNAIIANYLELPNQVDQQTGKIIPGFTHPALRKPTFVHSDIVSGTMKVRESK